MASTRAIGVVIPSISNPVFAEALSGISEEIRTAGYNLMLTVTDYDSTNEASAVGALMGHQVDGLILTVADPDVCASLDMLERARVPYVLVYNQPGEIGRPTISVDNVAAGGEVARALAALGHTSLGMIAGSFDASDRARARQSGFAAAAHEAGLDDPVIREVDFVDGDIEKVVAGLYDGGGCTPTALFCSKRSAGHLGDRSAAALRPESAGRRFSYRFRRDLRRNPSFPHSDDCGAAVTGNGALGRKPTARPSQR